MIIWLSHRWHGYLLVQLHGFSPERFLNLCSANHIEIWNLQYVEDGYQFFITLTGYRKVKPLVRKSKVRLKILKKFGLPFFLYRNRKRKLYFAGCLSFFLLLYMMSLFIWDIEFEGNQTYTYDTLIKFFESQDIRYGMPKSKISCDNIEDVLRTQFSEITWVSARVSGTRLLVKIKENEVLSKIPEQDEEICDIVASKDGVITKMIVRQGTPQVSIGDTVEQGQVLVKGAVEITDDNGETVNTHYIHSDADIIARTQYQYRKTYPLLHPVTVQTGRTRKGLYLKAFEYSMVFMMPRPEQTEWTLVMEEEQLKLFENFYLPFYIGKIKGTEYITYDRFYTEEEKNKLLEATDRQFVKNLIEKGVQIIENNVRILENEKDCIIEGNFITEESIGIKQAVTPEEMVIPEEPER